MPLYINAEQAADFFAARRKNLPRDASDFHTRDKLLLNVETLLRMEYPKTLFVWDAVLMNECDGCVWNGKRHQKCSCCRRNRNMKDNYKEETKHED